MDLKFCKRYVHSEINRYSFWRWIHWYWLKAFLDRLARNLDISEGEYKNILVDYLSHPINPPTSYDSRLERLYDLARMVHVDRIKGTGEDVLLKKIGIGLGFRTDNVKYIVDKALILVSEGVDLDTFIYEMKHMNR